MSQVTKPTSVRGAPIVCPACHAGVELKSDGSGLKCVNCLRVYPIRDEIPVMLVDEATIEDDDRD